MALAWRVIHMSKAEDAPNSSEQENPDATNLMKIAAPFIFERALVEEKDDHKREEVVRAFVHSPLTSFETIVGLLRYAAHLSTQGDSSPNRLVVGSYAKKAMNVFLNERTSLIKNGISFQHLFKGTVVHTVGQVLNEGVTEWLARKVSSKYLSNDDLRKELLGDSVEDVETILAELHEKDGTYFFEVKSAELLMAMVGEDMVVKAYLSPEMDDWNALANAYDSYHEPRAFFHLLSLTDHHEWREVFRLLAPRNRLRGKT
jgi:hypothetical protein